MLAVLARRTVKDENLALFKTIILDSLARQVRGEAMTAR